MPYANSSSEVVMGYVFEVKVWTSRDGGRSYHYEDYWEGDSVFQLLRKLYTAKREGFGLITVDWRPINY